MPQKLQFKDYARQKPLSITEDGKLLTMADLAASPSLGLGSLHILDADLQLKLAVERYALEPDFKLAIMGVGVKTRDEIIDEMKRRTDFGDTAVRVEMAYCNELMAALASGEGPAKWPDMPKPPAETSPDFKPDGKIVLLKLKNEALFCENTTDSVTKPIAARRAATVIPAFQARGFLVCTLSGADDIRAKFVPQAKSPLTVYIGGIGHGNYTFYTGYLNAHILEVGMYDPAEVAGHAMHFLSCRTGAQLGPNCVTKGAKAYSGYTENFTFVWDDATTPVNEFLLFIDADSTFDILMANGKTAGIAYSTTLMAFNAAIAKVPGTAAASWLAYDRDHFKLFGNAAAVIQPFRYVRITLPLTEAEKEMALITAGELVE